MSKGKPHVFAFGPFMFYSIKLPAARFGKWSNPIPILMDYHGFPSLFPSFVVNYNSTNDEYPSGLI